MRFAMSVLENRVTPVRLPPGELRLFTRPNRTGSDPMANTTGIVVVAACAARAETMSPVAAITATYGSPNLLRVPEADIAPDKFLFTYTSSNWT